jgi:hypothetical protein
MSQPTIKDLKDLNQSSFDAQILDKIGPYPHYPGPIANVGGLRVFEQVPISGTTNGAQPLSLVGCRVPGLAPFRQIIVKVDGGRCPALSNHCFEYGNARFPASCSLNERAGCKYCNTCPSTCGSCNHNANVIFSP